ncbi:MAG: hypothetical protein IPL28_03380 [Chloroflexi bacterium]|nr:hypothetical protein [Chloroflexota bacterium]
MKQNITLSSPMSWQNHLNGLYYQFILYHKRIVNLCGLQATLVTAGKEAVDSTPRDWVCWDDGTVDPCHSSFSSVDFLSTDDGWAVGVTRYFSEMVLVGLSFPFQTLTLTPMTGSVSSGS